MSLENGYNNMVMPVAPAYNGYGMNGGGNFNDAWWLIILLLFGYGGFGYGGGNGAYQAGNIGGAMYPWMNQLDSMNQGFASQALNTQIGDIRSDMNRGFADSQLGLANLSQQMCQSNGNLINNMNSGFAQAEISANNRQMANMQQSFNNVQAIDSRLDAIAAAQQNCCCENRAAISDLKYTVATENCADRYEAAQNTRDIIDAISNKTQMLSDKLCQLELDNVKSQLDAERRANVALQNQLSMAASKADGLANTSAILAGQVQRANEIEQYVNPTARPAYIVQNPNCCSNYAQNNCNCNGMM